MEALGQLLDRVGITVTGHTTSPTEALALVDEDAPDLLIVEVEATDGDVDGWQCLRRAREGHPDVKVIAVADATDERSIDAAFASGASAFCSKAADPEDFAAAIRQSFEHSIYLATSRGSVGATAVVGSVAAAPTPAHELTKRELEILQLVAEGYSNSQLGRMLWVTEQTVKFHLSNIYRKLDVANRTEASR
ncbi:MAG: LuxR C-terminal-related transcriptional regulator, partial [Pseudomonadota bacterium]